VQIEYQHPNKTLRVFLSSESRRTLPHPHNRLVVGSSPTGPTTSLRSRRTSLDYSSPRGTPGRTANLRAPYHVQLEGEDGYSGFASMKDDNLVNYISGFYEKDLPLFIHALGDGAVDQAIMALSAAKKAHPGGDRRTQLIHLQQVQDDQYETLQNLDVTMTYQIAHNFYFADFHAKNTLGPERTAALNPIQAGINYGFSTTP